MLVVGYLTKYRVGGEEREEREERRGESSRSRRALAGPLFFVQRGTGLLVS